MPRQTAASLYESRLETARKLLDEIDSGLDRHCDGAPHWGHAGDLGAIIETLGDLADRLHGRGEYARQPRAAAAAAADHR